MSNLICALLPAVFIAGASAGIAAAAPSDRFDLSVWKLTLPETEGEGDDDRQVQDLAGFEHPELFYLTPDGAMVFVAPIADNSESDDYPRCELREKREPDDADLAEWTLEDGGTLSATLTVDEVPTTDRGTPGSLVVAQVRGDDDELVRLYYEFGTVYFANEQAGPDDEELLFPLKSAAGEFASIDLGEPFSFLIDARDQTLTVEVHADGQVYSSVTEINEAWQGDEFYFRTGLYLGVHARDGFGRGQVSFYALDLSHEPGGGRGGLAR